MFEKGESGNPNGRPKGTGKKQSLVLALQDYLDEEENGESRLQSAMKRLYKDDLKTFMAYAYGKPKETVELTGAEGVALFPPEVVAAAHAIAKTL